MYSLRAGAEIYNRSENSVRCIGIAGGGVFTILNDIVFFL